MKENELRKKLIAAAKNHVPSAAAPYAFEKRIMSRLAETAAPNVWALWGGPLWRAALSCLAITVLCGIWLFAADRKARGAENFTRDFEAAICAPASQPVEDAW